ncbi:MAG: HEAT repeat domain-containing protein [Planctomycetota bacterium]
MRSLCRVIVFVSLLVAQPARGEPASIAELARELVDSADVYDEIRMARAVESFVRVGEAAQPQLVALTRHANSNVRWKAVEALESIDATSPSVWRALETCTEDADPDVRAQAASAIARRYFATRPGVVRLQKLTKDDQDLVRSNAYWGLWKFERRPRALKFWISCLESSDWMVVECATKYLVAAGARSLPYLRAALQSTSKPRRLGAIRTLGSLAPISTSLLDVVAKELHSDGREVSAAAAEACANFGWLAAPTLAEALSNEAPHVRVGAARALGRVGPQRRTGLDFVALALRRAIDDPVAAVRAEALKAFARRRYMPAVAVRRIVNALQSKDPDERGQALEAVEQATSRELRTAVFEVVRAMAEGDAKSHLRTTARRWLESATR